MIHQPAVVVAALDFRVSLVAPSVPFDGRTWKDAPTDGVVLWESRHYGPTRHHFKLRLHVSDHATAPVVVRASLINAETMQPVQDQSALRLGVKPQLDLQSALRYDDVPDVDKREWRPASVVPVTLAPGSTVLIGARIERLSRWVDNKHYRVLLRAQTMTRVSPLHAVAVTPAINVVSKVTEKRRAKRPAAPLVDGVDGAAVSSSTVGSHGSIAPPISNGGSSAGPASRATAPIDASTAPIVTSAAAVVASTTGATSAMPAVEPVSAPVELLRTEQAQLEQRVAELRQQSTELARRVQESARLLLLLHTQIQNKQRELEAASQQATTPSAHAESSRRSVARGGAASALSSYLLPEAFGAAADVGSGSQTVSLSLDPASFGFDATSADRNKSSRTRLGQGSRRSRRSPSAGHARHQDAQSLAAAAAAVAASAAATASATAAAASSRRVRRRIDDPSTPDQQPALLMDTLTTSPLLWWSPGGGGAQSPEMEPGRG